MASLTVFSAHPAVQREKLDTKVSAQPISAPQSFGKSYSMLPLVAAVPPVNLGASLAERLHHSAELQEEPSAAWPPQGDVAGDEVECTCVYALDEAVHPTKEGWLPFV